MLTAEDTWEWELPPGEEEATTWLLEAISRLARAAGAGEPIPVEAEEVARITRGRE